MRVHLIGRSGFHVELEKMNLPFDCYRGKLPMPDPDKPLFMFVSHAHPDHFQKSIFLLAERTGNMVCFLSDDIRHSALPLWAQGNVRLFAPETETESCHLVQDAKSEGPRQETFLKVSTCRSTDEGVVFLVGTAEARIYHAGDLNNWHWEENTTAENNAQHTLYLEGLREIRAEVKRNKRISDIAFTPVNSRLGVGYQRDANVYIREIGARRLVPIHLYGGASVIQKLREREASRSYRNRTLETGREGEVFTL